MKLHNNNEINLNKPKKAYHNLGQPSKVISKELRMKQLKAQSEEMEAIFLAKMIKAMEQTIPKDENSSQKSLSSMMFSGEMGKAIAKNGGIGLAKFIFSALKDKDADLGKELMKLNQEISHDKTQSFNLENKVF